MRNGRLVFIGDSHGCRAEFEALIDKVKPATEDEVVCLGDFFDKGPDAAGAVKFARQIGARAIRGNHEDWYLRYRKHEKKRATDPKYANPMKAMPFEGEDLLTRMSEDDWAWIEALPLYRRWPGIVAVHGGLRPGYTPETHDPGELMRLRWVDEAGKHVPVDYDVAGGTHKKVSHWVTRYNGQDHVVYGHEAHTLSVPHVHKTPQGALCFGVDTGCVHGGHLTALIVEPDLTYRFEQVRAERAYRVPHEPIPWA